MYTRCKAGLGVSIPPLAATAFNFFQVKDRGTVRIQLNKLQIQGKSISRTLSKYVIFKLKNKKEYRPRQKETSCIIILIAEQAEPTILVAVYT